jgi:hypothetical protein
MALKAGTSIQAGLPVLTAHLSACLPCLCLPLALLISCNGLFANEDISPNKYHGGRYKSVADFIHQQWFVL